MLNCYIGFAASVHGDKQTGKSYKFHVEYTAQAANDSGKAYLTSAE